METAREIGAGVREANGFWFRSSLIFATGERWYFHTREGVDIGPYDSRFEAEIEAGILRELLHGIEQGEPALAVIREFVLDSYGMGRPLVPNFRIAASP
jgi:hypothetical protein